MEGELQWGEHGDRGARGVGDQRAYPAVGGDQGNCWPVVDQPRWKEDEEHVFSQAKLGLKQIIFSHGLQFALTNPIPTAKSQNGD